MRQELFGLKAIFAVEQKGKKMMKRYTVVAVLALAAALTGCATPNKMAFQDKNERITDKSKPVLLMTATIKNGYKTDYQPHLMVVYFEKPGAKDSADRQNFVMDALGREETNTAANGNTYLLRMPLDAGPYELVGMRSTYDSFWVHGSFFTPLHSTVNVQGPGVYYLGHVDATVRERQGNEFKAGIAVPVIDQAVVGATGGTFDVEISDQFATDEALFRSKFPALNGVTIQKAILPKFDRVAAQQWWEAH